MVLVGINVYFLIIGGIYSKRKYSYLKINFINESGERVIICMNLSDVCVNGRLIEEYPVFMEFLRSLIPKKQLAVR